jgi:hypothetical protein
LLALIGALPLALESTASVEVNGIIAYIGADAIFLFWLVLAWFLWLKTAARGVLAPLVLGLVTGLAASTKINGAFLVIGAAAYFAAFSSGWRRLTWPFAVCLTALAVYLALNPVYLGGPAWTLQVFRDTIARRLAVKNEHLSVASQTYSRGEMIYATLPCLYLIVPVAGILVGWRRAWWFGPTAFWSLSIIALHLVFLYRFMPQYAAPVRAAFLIVFMAAGLSAAREAWRGRARLCGPASLCSSLRRLLARPLL